MCTKVSTKSKHVECAKFTKTYSVLFSILRRYFYSYFLLFDEIQLDKFYCCALQWRYSIISKGFIWQNIIFRVYSTHLRYGHLECNVILFIKTKLNRGKPVHSVVCNATEWQQSQWIEKEKWHTGCLFFRCTYDWISISCHSVMRLMPLQIAFDSHATLSTTFNIPIVSTVFSCCWRQILHLCCSMQSIATTKR